MRFFAMEGIYPTVLREDGRAFLWTGIPSSKWNEGCPGDWGQISANELMADQRTPELSEAEFRKRYPDADLSLEMTPDPELEARYSHHRLRWQPPD